VKASPVLNCTIIRPVGAAMSMRTDRRRDRYDKCKRRASRLMRTRLKRGLWVQTVNACWQFTAKH